MGEDRVVTLAKNGDGILPPSYCRQRHVSSCSEDAESETATNSTAGGYPPTPDEEKEEELQYGPGIVNKLRTRFLTISLKQNRGASIRRSCSMENLLETPVAPRICNGYSINKGPEEQCTKSTAYWGNLKRAKSMDTLLMDLQQQQQQQELTVVQSEGPKEPKIVRSLNRTGPTICDEELPKPDTVKTYKRMFEPAESRRASHSRKPPVLRASAKSSSGGQSSVCKTNNNNNNSGVSSSPLSCAKVNGVTSMKPKLSAKPAKAQPDSETIHSNGLVASNQPLVNGSADPKPLCNGNYVKATPVKIADSPCNGKVDTTSEKEVNGPDTVVNKKDGNQKNSVICNGNSAHRGELIKTETKEDYVKPDVKKLVNQTYRVHNGSGDKQVTNVVNGLNVKPKVPPNRPNFIKNVKPGAKVTDMNGMEKNVPQIPKLKPTPNSIHRKIQDKLKSEISSSKIPMAPVISDARINGDVARVESPRKETKIPEIENDKSIVEKNNKKNMEKIEQEEVVTPPLEKTNQATPKKELVSEMVNGDVPDSEKPSKIPKAEGTAAEVKPEPKPAKKQSADPITTSMVFDFRGKDVVPHVAVLPVPFGCKALHPKKKSLLVDGKEATPNGVSSDDDDEYSMDYSVPPPCGVVFEGENVKIGKGSILSMRNKDLKIKFDDNVDDNTFVYPSETSLMEDSDQSLSPTPPPSEVIPNGQPSPCKLKSNPAIGSSGAGGLSTYTPSVLRTMDNFEPGMFRPHPAIPEKEDDSKKVSQSGEEENTEVREDSLEQEMLKPADPGIISSWSLSAGTSDLLF